MPVDETHPAYNAMAPTWAKMRDVIGGEEAVKAAGDAYLPKLGGQEAKDYEAYKMRALFFEATGRTVDAMTGLVFRKEPQVDVPDAMRPYLEDMDMAGQPFSGLAEVAVEEVLGVARIGMLVDYPVVEDGEQLTQQQAEERGFRPFVTTYPAESITNWQVGRVNNSATLVSVTLYEEDGEEPQYRVLELDDNGYRQDIYQWEEDSSKKNGGEWVKVETRVPMMQGQPLSYIPFVIVNDRDLKPEVRRPQLVGLANVNLSHYRTSADLEHGAHFTALPTPWVKGVKQDEIEAGAFDAVGPEGIWMSTSETAEFGLLEFQGTGLQALEKRLESKEQKMATLGARLLAPEKRAVEAAETAQINRAGESSTLASIANSVSRALTRVLEIMRDWSGTSGDVSVQLNTDFMPAQMDAKTLDSLTSAVQSGQISRETYIRNLQRGEIIKEEEDPQEEIDRIEGDSAVGLGMGGGQ